MKEDIKKQIKKSNHKELDEILTEIYKIKRTHSVGGGGGNNTL